MSTIELNLRRGLNVRPSRLWYIAGLAAVCCLPLLLYLPFLAEPFERDEGTYATVAQMLLHGQVPYRDIFDHKPPLVYVWYAASFLLFGESLIAPRLMVALALSLTTALVFVEGRLLGWNRRALVAAATFGLTTGLAPLQANANTEAFMLLPMTASLVAFTLAHRSGDGRWYLAAGLLGGLAVLTKQVSAANLLALVAFELITMDLKAWRTVASHIALMALGCLAPLLATVAIFALAGALDEFVYANWTYNALYRSAGQDSASMLVANFGSFGIVTAPFLLFAAIGLVGLLRGGRRAGLLLPLWFAGSLLGVLLPGRYTAHYFVQLLPSLALLAAVGLDALLEGRTGRLKNLGLAVALPLALLACLSTNLRVYLAPSPEQRHELKFATPLGRWEAASPAVARELTAMLQAGDTLYNWGRETQLYYYTHRAPPVRFAYDRPFVLDPPTLDETMTALAAAPPTYIVDTLQPPVWEYDEETHPPVFTSFLAARYDLVRQLDFALVYRLR